MKMEQTEYSETSTHKIFRSRGITQNKGYNIQNANKVWNQENCIYVSYISYHAELTVKNLRFKHEMEGNEQEQWMNTSRIL